MPNSTLFDIKMKEALEIYFNNQLAKLPSNEELKAVPEPSAKYIKNMQRLLKKSKGRVSGFSTVRKRVLVAAIVFILMLTTIFSVEAIREPVRNFFINIYEKFSTIIFHTDEAGTKDKDNAIEKIYSLQNLPEGYELVFEDITPLNVHQEFSDGDNYLFYDQTLSSSLQQTIDTEEVTTEDIIINGYSGIYYYNKEYHNILWNDGEYTFELASTMTKSALLELAKSLK